MTAEKPLRVTTDPAPDLSPTWSPDGRYLAFARISEGNSAVYDARWTFNSAWTADSREIVFGSWTGGSRQLWRVAVSGAKPEPLAIGANGEDPTISRHANRLAYVERIYNTDIWRIEAPTSQKQGVQPTTLDLNSSQEDSNPQYSPDGRSIVFVSRRSGGYEIWVCDSEGRNSRPLTSFPQASVTASPRWSPG